MTLRRRATLGAAWATFEAWGQWAVALLVFWGMTRLLGPETWGLVAMATVLVAFADALVTTGGWSDAIVQRKDLRDGHVATAFWWLLALSGLAMLVCIVAAPAIARFFDQPTLTDLVVAMSLVLPVKAAAAIPVALLRRELDFKPLALRSVLATGGGGGVGIAAALSGWGVWSLVAQQLAQALIELVVLWSVCRWRPKAAPSWRDLHELNRYALPATADRLLLAFDDVVMRSAIGFLLGPAPLGQYVFVRSLLDLTSRLLLHPLTRVAMPTFARLQRDRQRLQEALASSSRITCLVAVPSFLGLAGVAPTLLLVVFGTTWTPAAPLLQILALAGSSWALGNIDVALMRGVGKVGLQLKVSLLSTVLLLALVLTAGPYGLAAIGWAFVARAWLVLPLRHGLITHALALDRRRERRACLAILLAALTMLGAVLSWRALAAGYLPAVGLLASSVGVGVAVYTAAASALLPSVVSEVRALLRGRLVLPAADRRQP